MRETRPDLVEQYDLIYRGNKWGQSTPEYCRSVDEVFHLIAKAYRMPVRIPPPLFQALLDENDLVMVLLEHIDYLLKLKGQTSPFGYAAYSLSQVKQPLSTMRQDLRGLKGVGKIVERTIIEILETGKSSYHETLLTE